jgi:hypothetical protein
MMLKKVKNVNVCKKREPNAFLFKYPIYIKVSRNEGLQFEHVDMVEKLKLLTEVVQNERPNEVSNSWKFQVEELYKEVVLSSNYEE